MRYHGGKWLLAEWIISFFPPHRVYVECFGGAASVLMRKPRTYAEVYNDLDGEIVNLFRVLRDSVMSERLRDVLELTPFSRAEYDLSYISHPDPVEQARRTIARSFMGFGSSSVLGRLSGFRADSNKSGSTPARDWSRYPACVPAMVNRLQGVVIEQKDALEVMMQHDSPKTLHYVDPPYMWGTRCGSGNTAKHRYRFEMTDEAHLRLLQFLPSLEGFVVLSGYPVDLYDEALAGWQKVERPALADGAAKRTECLWLSPNIGASQGLFAGVLA